jgi:hypothetical protein
MPCLVVVIGLRPLKVFELERTSAWALGRFALFDVSGYADKLGLQAASIIMPALAANTSDQRRAFHQDH